MNETLTRLRERQQRGARYWTDEEIDTLLDIAEAAERIVPDRECCEACAARWEALDAALDRLDKASLAS